MAVHSRYWQEEKLFRSLHHISCSSHMPQHSHVAFSMQDGQIRVVPCSELFFLANIPIPSSLP